MLCTQIQMGALRGVKSEDNDMKEEIKLTTREKALMKCVERFCNENQGNRLSSFLMMGFITALNQILGSKSSDDDDGNGG